MSYIVDYQRFTPTPAQTPGQQLEAYLNNKYTQHPPWELVNIIKVSQLYSTTQDVLNQKPCGIDVQMVWRTHAVNARDYKR